MMGLAVFIPTCRLLLVKAVTTLAATQRLRQPRPQAQSQVLRQPSPMEMLCPAPPLHGTITASTPSQRVPAQRKLSQPSPLSPKRILHRSLRQYQLPQSPLLPPPHWRPGPLQQLSQAPHAGSSRTMALVIPPSRSMASTAGPVKAA